MLLLRVLIFLALICTLARAEITITNSTITFNAEATGITRFFKGPSFEDFTAPLVAFDSDVDKTNSIVLITPVSGATWETLLRKEVAAGALGIIIYNRFWTYNPGRIELIFDGSDVSDIDIPTVEIIQSLGIELYNQLNNGEPVSVTMRCCDPNTWLEAYASFTTIMTVICAAGSAAVIACALWKLLLFTEMFQKWRPINLAKVLLLLIIIASLVMGVMIPLDPFWTKQILTFPAGSFFISSPVTAAYTITLLITFYWLELIKKKDTRVLTVLQKFKIPYIIAIVVLWAIEFVNSALRASFLDLNTLTTVGIVISACVAVTVVVVFLWSTIRILNKLQNRDNVASKSSARLRKSSIMIMIGGLSNAFATVMYVITFTNFYHTPYGFPMPFFLSYLCIQLTYLLQLFAFVPPKSGKSGKSSDSTQMKQTTTNPSRSSMIAETAA